MSDVPQTLALIILAQQYARQIVSQVNRRTTLLRTIPIVPDVGKNVAWAVKSSGAVTEYYADGADVDDYGSDGQASAVLDWALIRSTARVTGLARSSAAGSSSPEGNAALWGQNIADSIAELASKINLGCFSGNGSASPKEITGLDTAIGSSTATYATIVRSNTTYFDPYLVDPGSATSITLAQIRTDLAGIYTACGEHPDVAVCSPGVFNSVMGLFDSRTTYVKQLDQIETRRGKISFGSFSQAAEVEGVILLKDKDATAGQIYYLNTNHVSLVPQVSPKMLELGVVPGQVLTANDGFGPIPLLMTLEALAKTGDSDKYSVKCYLELKVDRPNSCGVRKNVAYS